MSADRWSYCPKCTVPQPTKEDKLREVRDLYGKVSQQEYEDALAKAQGFKVKEPTETLREDWDFYWDGNKLVLNYGCTCERCGFSATWKTEKKMA